MKNLKELYDERDRSVRVNTVLSTFDVMRAQVESCLAQHKFSDNDIELILSITNEVFEYFYNKIFEHYGKF